MRRSRSDNLECAGPRCPRSTVYKTWTLARRLSEEKSGSNGQVHKTRTLPRLRSQERSGQNDQVRKTRTLRPRSRRQANSMVVGRGGRSTALSARKPSLVGRTRPPRCILQARRTPFPSTRGDLYAKLSQTYRPCSPDSAFNNDLWWPRDPAEVDPRAPWTEARRPTCVHDAERRSRRLAAEDTPTGPARRNADPVRSAERFARRVALPARCRGR